jgi:hypothetical protein
MIAIVAHLVMKIVAHLVMMILLEHELKCESKDSLLSSFWQTNPLAKSLA